MASALCTKYGGLQHHGTSEAPDLGSGAACDKRFRQAKAKACSTNVKAGAYGGQRRQK